MIFRRQALLTLGAVVWISTARLGAAESLDYNRDVRPILADKCFKCHGPDPRAREA